jgi:transcriptional regulator with XRE-family HTH domain
MGDVGPGSPAYAFGRKIWELRKARGWKQEDLARRLTAAGRPMHQTSVARLELGTHPTGIADIAALAAIFEVPAAALLEDDSPEARWRELRVQLAEIREERDRLQSQLAVLDGKYKPLLAEYRKLGRKLGEEMDDGKR